MNTKNKVYAQGDILFVPINNIPENIKVLERNGGAIVLAEGEVTGHFHKIQTPEIGAWINEKDDIFIEVRNLIAEVTHNEHNTVALPKGNYKVVKQRQYQQGKFQSNIQPVQD